MYKTGRVFRDDSLLNILSAFAKARRWNRIEGLLNRTVCVCVRRAHE